MSPSPEQLAATALSHRIRANACPQLRSIGCGQRINESQERELQHEAERELALAGWFVNADEQLVRLPL